MKSIKWLLGSIVVIALGAGAVLALLGKSISVTMGTPP